MEKTKKEIEESHKPTPFLPGASYKKNEDLMKRREA